MKKSWTEILREHLKRNSLRLPINESFFVTDADIAEGVQMIGKSGQALTIIEAGVTHYHDAQTCLDPSGLPEIKK